MLHCRRSAARTVFGSCLALLAVLTGPAALAATSELFISEYIEGSSNNKAIEIYNGTGSTVNLATGLYDIQMYFNGSGSAGLTIALTGSVADGDVYVLRHASATLADIIAQGDQTNGAGWFNGDDAVVLRKNGVIIDVLGQIGSDPGTEWGTGLTSTADNTLTRKASVCAGDINGADAFNPATEWNGFAQDTTSSLGSHLPSCGPTPPTGVGASNPTSGEPGASTILTVTVTAGTNPASTTHSVSGDLTLIGGSATQTFYDDGLTGGDTLAGDGIFTFTATVSLAATPGAKSLPFTVSEVGGLSRSSNGNIAYTVTPPDTPIHQIQGSGSQSAYDGQLVKVNGIVTAIRSNNGFFVQEPDADADADPGTSEGIFVFTGGAPTVSVGDEVTVVGTVDEFFNFDPVTPPITEIANPGLLIKEESALNPLPSAATITAADAAAGTDIEQLERFEGMRVYIESMTVVAPTSGFEDQDNADSASDGTFYGVVTGVARPFREPGVDALDPIPSCIPGPCAGVPVFDTNPQRIRVDSDRQPTAPKIEVNTGAIIEDLYGVLHYDTASSFRPRAYIIYPDPTPAPTITHVLTDAIPAAVPLTSEFTVASTNLQRFFNDSTLDGGAGSETPTPAAYQKRLDKASLLIREVLQSPDVIALQEIENISTLTDIAQRVADDGGPAYDAYLEEGFDPGGIDSGFLVKVDPQCEGAARVIVNSVVQEIPSPNEYYDPLSPTDCFESSPGVCDVLQDRPPLFLYATVVHPLGLTYDVTVVNVHNRSLGGVDGSDGYRIRAKRRAQAEHLAGLLDSKQGTDNIIALGDYNAFQFNDGLVDAIGTILGTPTAVNEAVLTSPDLVDPDLINATGLSPADEQYSFIFHGSAQELDHVILDESAYDAYAGLTHPRVNTDFAEEGYRGDGTRPERLSDHDPVVTYFEFPKEVAVVTPDADNLCSVQVSAPGGTAASVVLYADVTDEEPNPPCEDRICLAGPSFDVVLYPVGPGSPIAGTVITESCTDGTLVIKATFLNVPVNIYEVVFSVDAANPYYTGSGSSVLVIFDPSLGFVTAGGTVINPDTGNRANFGVNAKYNKKTAAQGSVLYIEHTPDGPIKVKSNSLKGLSIIDNEAVIITKNATVTPTPGADPVGNYEATVRVIDNGEPGTSDEFGLQVKNPSKAIVGDLTYDPETIRSGNVQVPHTPKK